MKTEMNAETLNKLELDGFNLVSAEEFYGDYVSTSFVIMEKREDKQVYIAEFSYCSCGGFYDETYTSIKSALQLLTPEVFSEIGEYLYGYDAAEIEEFRNRLKLIGKLKNE